MSGTSFGTFWDFLTIFEQFSFFHWKSMIFWKNSKNPYFDLWDLLWWVFHMVLALNHWFRPKNEGSKKSVPQNCKSAGSDALKTLYRKKMMKNIIYRWSLNKLKNWIKKIQFTVLCLFHLGNRQWKVDIKPVIWRVAPTLFDQLWAGAYIEYWWIAAPRRVASRLVCRWFSWK